MKKDSNPHYRLGLLLALIVCYCVGQLLGCDVSGAEETSNDAASDAAADATKEDATDFISADDYLSPRYPDKNNTSLLIKRGMSEPVLPDDLCIKRANSSSGSYPTGDLYRVLDENRILNLNSYRGFQIIDLSDISNPSILGRLDIAARPAGLHAWQDRVAILVDRWTDYYMSTALPGLTSIDGGLLLLVDISAIEEPKILDQRFFEHSQIVSSFLAQNGDAVNLYMTTVKDSYEEPVPTEIRGFDISGNVLRETGNRDLSCRARNLPSSDESLRMACTVSTGRVTLIEISDSLGGMRIMDEVSIEPGLVRDFSVDDDSGILSVFVESADAASLNQLSTYDVTDLSAVQSLSSCAFGANESIVSTRLMSDRAFAVTATRQDFPPGSSPGAQEYEEPDHAIHGFAIDGDGGCEEVSVVSLEKWSGRLSPVFDDRRLIGLFENRSQEDVEVSARIYDISDQADPIRLIASTDPEQGQSRLEDDQHLYRFTLMDDALSGDGTEGETGLLFAPLKVWQDEEERYRRGVQIYTFSPGSVTRRGFMEHETDVRYGFMKGVEAAVTVSVEEARFYSLSDPSLPQELGRLKLAPNYTQIIPWGDYSIRIEDRQYLEDLRSGVRAGLSSLADVIRSDENPSEAEPVARLELATGSYAVKAGDYLVGLAAERRAGSDENSSYETNIDIYDLSDPTVPSRLPSLSTNVIGSRPFFERPYGPTNVRVVGDAVVLIIPLAQEQYQGMESICSRSPDEPCDTAAVSRCSYKGNLECHSLENEEEYCVGEMRVCRVDDEHSTHCDELIDYNSISTAVVNCVENQSYRYWSAYSFYILDLSPDEPKLSEPIEMPSDDEGVAFIARNNRLYYSYRRPAKIEDDPRRYVRYYLKVIDLGDPSRPVVGPEINVSGKLLRVEDEAIYTRDLYWDYTSLNVVIDKLELEDDIARRIQSHDFGDREVHAILVDPERSILVEQYKDDMYLRYHFLTELDLDTLDDLREIDMTGIYGKFLCARDGDILSGLNEGLVVLNLDDAEGLRSRAYFSADNRFWPSEIRFVGKDIYIAVGRHGIHKYGDDYSNWLNPAQWE